MTPEEKLKIEEQIVEMLKTVYDPEIPVDIYNLGLIYNIDLADDGLLDIPFTVTSFRTVFFDNMGNAVPLASNGSQFSAQQKEQFRHLSRNKRFYITNVIVHGPDGTTRTLNGRNMEVIVQ